MNGKISGSRHVGSRTLKCTLIFGTWFSSLEAIIIEDAGEHLASVSSHVSLLIEVIESQRQEISRAYTPESQKGERYEEVMAEYREHLDEKMERIEALSHIRPLIDVGYEEVFMKSPVRVSDMGMLNAAVLTPYLDTAATVGFGQWNLGVSYKNAYQYAVAPLEFNPDALFIDVNDLNFGGFGSIEWFGSISGTMEKKEIYGVFGVTDFIDVGFRVPFMVTPEYVLYDAVNFRSYAQKLNHTEEMGDIEFWLKWRLWSSPGYYIRTAVRGDMRLATGNQEQFMSLGHQQMSLSYIVTLQPYSELTANFTMGSTYLQGDSSLFNETVEVTTLGYFGGGVVHRFGENWALGGQMERFTNPWKKIPLDIFQDDIASATGLVKYSFKDILSELSYTRGLTRSSPESIFTLNFSTKQTLRNERR
jgi:hypothetical protein